MGDEVRVPGLGDPNNVAHPDRALAELVDRQHGVVARRQLGALGMSETMTRDRVQRGLLVRLHRGVYAVGHRRLRREGWWMAAVLAAGPGAALSHRDAAALHGLLPAGDHRRVEVATSRRAASSETIHVRRATALGPLDVTTRLGIPVTTVARTLVDLASGSAGLAKAFEEAERRGLLDGPAVEQALARTRTRPGPGHRAVKRELQASADARMQLTRSVLEERFLALLDANELPRPLTNHWLDGFEVDAFWPRQRLVVELDGWEHHSAPRPFQRDRSRTNRLQALGYRVLRLTHADVVRRPAGTVALLSEALRRYPPTS